MKSQHTKASTFANRTSSTPKLSFAKEPPSQRTETQQLDPATARILSFGI